MAGVGRVEWEGGSKTAPGQLGLPSAWESHIILFSQMIGDRARNTCYLFCGGDAAGVQSLADALAGESRPAERSPLPGFGQAWTPALTACSRRPVSLRLCTFIPAASASVLSACNKDSNRVTAAGVALFLSESGPFSEVLQ